MALNTTGQAAWNGGIYRGRQAPAASVYDAVNALINDEGNLFKRGGSTYVSTSDASESLLGIIAHYMPLADGVHAYAWGATTIFDVTGATPTSINTTIPRNRTRPVSTGDYLVWPLGVTGIGYFAGSVATNYSTGTVTVANGSATVTGVGTLWLANATRGQLFGDPVNPMSPFIAIESVDSDTQITLRSPWPGTSLAAHAYGLRRTSSLAIFSSGPIKRMSTITRVGVAGTVPRVLVGTGNRVYFTPPGAVQTFDANSYHELVDGAAVTGIEGIGDTALVFSTAGVWAIENLDLDPVDDSGNIQQQVVNLSKDIMLWNERGLAAWSSAVVVPALDDVWLMSPGQRPTPLSGERNANDTGIRSLYRSYVAAGYMPGFASVYQGHYVLPIVDPATNAVIDVLVCRLDHGFAWTRWAGSAAGLAFASFSDGDGAPDIYGVQGARAINITGAFTPTSANAQDADGSNFDCTIITRDYSTGGNQPGTVDRIRGRYELTDDGNGGTAAPTVAVAYSSDQDAGAFTTLSSFGSEDGGTGGATSDASEYSWWKVGKRRAKIRYRITQTGAAASFVWRSLEMLTRQSSNR